MENEFKVIDSSEYHKDNQSEIKYKFSFYSDYLKKFIFSKYCVILILWLILLKFAMVYEIAKIYIMLSGFALIFTNLGKRAPGTLSAYSVFNKNNEKLLGTFDINSVE